MKSSRDSPHSRSDRLLQAQVWRGFGLRFQMKSGGRNAWLGQLKEILPLPPPRSRGITQLIESGSAAVLSGLISFDTFCNVCPEGTFSKHQR